ncbi:MAG: NUDIX hydrolase [Kiritimatiellia bacterium]|jgi:ADP-ribose pyrophosphatase|nr:NUDIX hydrolase [Kiritimatiellia bacterium]MDP6811194.1 NUDIX hydrolase [Kiritimatiellia bacterium]
MNTWKTLAKEMWLDCGKFLKVERHTVDFGEGRVIDDWPWVITPDYVNIVAITPENRFVCLRQGKYAIEGASIGPVGGYIEEGDSPRDTAERELREETGYESDDWTFLGSFPVDSNRGVGTAHFFLARNARFVGHVESDDLEPQELILLSRQELESAIDDGGVKLLPWVSAFALALRKC